MLLVHKKENSAEWKESRARLLFKKKKKLRRKFTAERVIVIKFITGACCCVTETLACPYLPSSIT